MFDLLESQGKPISFGDFRAPMNLFRGLPTNPCLRRAPCCIRNNVRRALLIYFFSAVLSLFVNIFPLTDRRTLEYRFVNLSWNKIQIGKGDESKKLELPYWRGEVMRFHTILTLEKRSENFFFFSKFESRARE